jgi:hypothetical protein
MNVEPQTGLAACHFRRLADSPGRIRSVDYYLYPWPVEIVNQASFWEWLGPVLTFLGSVLLFAGSIYVMWRTNQAGDIRAAAERENQRERDFRLFQRDALLRIGDEVVQGAIETWEQFGAIRADSTPLRDGAFAPIDVWAQKIAADVIRLDLIGVNEPTQRCIALRDAITNQELRKTIADLDNLERLGIGAQLRGETAKHEAQVQELRTKYESLMGEIQTARSAFGESVKQELARTNRP